MMKLQMDWNIIENYQEASLVLIWTSFVDVVSIFSALNVF